MCNFNDGNGLITNKAIIYMAIIAINADSSTSASTYVLNGEYQVNFKWADL